MDLDAVTMCLPVKMLQSKQLAPFFSKLFRSTSADRLDHYRALGKSSLKPEDADSDYSSLTDEEKGVLDDWEKYFAKVRLRNSQQSPEPFGGSQLTVAPLPFVQRYNIVGKVVD